MTLYVGVAKLALSLNVSFATWSIGSGSYPRDRAAITFSGRECRCSKLIPS